MKFLVALKFLTIISLPGRREVSPEEMGHSIGYFPVVGIIIGLILAGLNWLLCLLLPLMVANALLIVFLVVITGGLHLDGFVDTCDGIAGHKTIEERWRVMHDSRAGAFGIVGIVLLLLVKYVSLNSLSSMSVPSLLTMVTLVFMPVVSRWAMAYAVFVYPYARPSGLGKAFKQGARWPGFTMATLITFLVALALPPWIQLTFLAIMFFAWIITVVMAAYLKRKFSGLTGDTYGAINEVVEVSVLILVCLLVQLGLA
ncbi:adenosylcobinamide-GDP ribazoletransferase [Chloroflexota bacterium]